MKIRRLELRMNDQNDDAQNYALMVLAGVVALVVAGVIALAAATTMGGTSRVAAPGAAGNAAAPRASGDPSAPAGRIYFELGSDALPGGASELLAKITDGAREQAGKRVLISGFHDASGDAAKNAELAKNRALAVRHALEANGVSPERLVMDKPAVTTGGADAREARRVEVRLR
jgi:outer membrane protein OmpA-like peptidoglycan-associated protein